jgi:hypothetical protein
MFRTTLSIFRELIIKLLKVNLHNLFLEQLLHLLINKEIIKYKIISNKLTTYSPKMPEIGRGM